MVKSSKKPPFVAKHLLKMLFRGDLNKKKEGIKTWSRSSTILPEMIGCVIHVYNGKKHVPLHVSDQIIGHKLGEFSMTRSFKSHKKLEKKVKK